MDRTCRVFLKLGLAVLLGAGLLVPSAVSAQAKIYQGTLGPGDAKLGRYFDIYPLQLAAGERLVATMSSSDFDAFLILECPDGTEMENDDYSEGGDARIDFLVEVPGEWKLKACSCEEGEQGAYLLSVFREKLQVLESHQGTLEEGDGVSVKGEYFDRYPLFLQRDQRIVISLRSDHFDPFLVLKPPRGRRIINDDYDGEGESRIDYVAETDGQYELFATSFTGEERGEYALRILLGGRANVKAIDGHLDADDPELEGYGYCQTHPLAIREGQHLIVEMISEELDTLLRLEGPDGYYAENDDYNDQTHISRLEVFAPASGRYTITAASFDSAVEGRYTLKIYSLEP